MRVKLEGDAEGKMFTPLGNDSSDFGPASSAGSGAVCDQKQAARAVKSAPKFTDEVRLQARPEDAASLVRPDGTAPRPAADLASFRNDGNQSANDLLALLPK